MKTPRTLSQSIIVFSTLVESLFFGVMDRKKKEGEEKRKKKKTSQMDTILFGLSGAQKSCGSAK